MTSSVPDLHKSLNGPYSGIVEATTDPKELGRVRVRFQSLDGDESQSPVKTLPWAMPCFPAFMFNPPQVGDAVWCMFEGGLRRRPVYFGWFPATPSVAQKRQRHPDLAGLTYSGSGRPLELATPREPTDNDSPEAGDEPFGDNIETYETPVGVCETPPEVRKGSSLDPNTRIFKTWRGHTLEFNDHPGSEYLKIIDRSGQMILFDCAVNKSDNENNATPRGGSIENSVVSGIGEADKEVNNGRTQLPIGVMQDNKACIRITDLFGQYLEMWSEQGKSRIRIQSARQKDDDQTPNHYFEISSENGNEYVKVETREGHSILINETSNEITITHKDGNTQVFNSSNIILADNEVNKRLVWLENMMVKFNTHVHPGVMSGGSSTAPTTTQLTPEDGTTVTMAG